MNTCHLWIRQAIAFTTCQPIGSVSDFCVIKWFPVIGKGLLAWNRNLYQTSTLKGKTHFLEIGCGKDWLWSFSARPSITLHSAYRRTPGLKMRFTKGWVVLLCSYKILTQVWGSNLKQPLAWIKDEEEREVAAGFSSVQMSVVEQVIPFWRKAGYKCDVDRNLQIQVQIFPFSLLWEEAHRIASVQLPSTGFLRRWVSSSPC